MASQPWMKFYPQDWRADEKLRLCSLAARGLWIEMLALMHRCERYGQLLIGGRVPTDAQLAVQVGTSPDQVSALVAELEEAGVFSRTASGAIYSRRMTRDHKAAETARKNGKKGGNPKLGNKKENPGWDNPPVNPEDKGGDKPQKPDARNQIPPNPPRGAADYAFAGQYIRLNRKDFDGWATVYHGIPDLRAELASLDSWLGTAAPAKQRNWFNTVAGCLNRKHQELVVKGAAGGIDPLVSSILARKAQRQMTKEGQANG